CTRGRGWFFPFFDFW
nr:immunoglobulin heavy chain junction region [Macaca mulatta]MOX14898.1 immunoglobulin heavy chain junction region [Macaca mulatta]MOX15783.1 immunoglobulin heavy chain junction region [Macaca mulatta]MOX15991.1 immunoglobulin heavy chain junction region [Macaca mulatta]MOX16259.1 immunoglobulin heavy chain junction region [Macaca mulatta]